MNIRELLTFVIDADVKGAVKGFDTISAASSKSLAKAETSLQKRSAGMVKWGAAAVSAGALVSLGMFKAAKSAGELALSTQRLEGIFEGSAGEMQKFAEEANRIGLSDKTATAALTNIGEAAVGLGLSADQAAKLAPQLVEVVTQLGILNGMPTAAALETVNAAMRGEYDSLQRLVPAISNATIVQEALANTGKATAAELTQTEKTYAALNLIIDKGTATIERSGGVWNTFAGRLAIAQSNIEDAWTTIGEGATVAVEPMITAVGDLAGVFTGLPRPAQEAAGSILAVGGALAVAGGSVSVAVGAFLNLYSRMAELAAIAPRLAAALKAVGAAAVPIGAALAVSAVLAQGWELVTHSAEEAAAAQEKVRDSIGTEQLAAFNDVVQDLRRGSGGFKGIANEILGTDIGPKLDEGKVALEQFNKLARESPGAAQNLVRAMDAAGEDTGKFKEALKEANAELGLSAVEADKAAVAQKKYADLIAGGEASESALADAKAEVVRTSQDQAGTQALVNAAVEEGTGKVEDATDATTDLADAAKELDYAFGIAGTTLQDWNLKALEEGATGFADAIERASNLDDFIGAASSLGAATTDFRENLEALPPTIDQMKLALGGYNEEQTTAIDAMLALSDETTNYLTTLIESGATNAEVTGKADQLRKAYEEQMRQAGFTEEQIASYIDTLGLTPKDVTTAIKIKDHDVALAKLAILQDYINALPEDKRIDILLKVIRGDAAGAVRDMEAYLARQKLYITIYPVLGRLSGGFGAGIVGRAPRTAQQQQQQLSAGLRAAPGTSSAGTGSTVNVYMPAGADGVEVIHALRRHERRNGPRLTGGWRPV